MISSEEQILGQLNNMCRLGTHDIEQWPSLQTNATRKLHKSSQIVVSFVLESTSCFHDSLVDDTLSPLICISISSLSGRVI